MSEADGPGGAAGGDREGIAFLHSDGARPNSEGPNCGIRRHLIGRTDTVVSVTTSND
jgi:hypothetical protein